MIDTSTNGQRVICHNTISSMRESENTMSTTIAARVITHTEWAHMSPERKTGDPERGTARMLVYENGATVLAPVVVRSTDSFGDRIIPAWATLRMSARAANVLLETGWIADSVRAHDDAASVVLVVKFDDSACPAEDIVDAAEYVTSESVQLLSYSSTSAS